MTPDIGPIEVGALIAYVTMVALVDINTHRIPNALSATAAVLGLSLQLWVDGAPGVLSALGGAALGLAMFLPFYLLRAFGAGDVKAMATVGIFLGAQLTLLAAAFTLVVGSIIGVIVLLLSSRAVSVPAAPASSQVRRFPYGGAIAIGTLATLLVISAGHVRF